VKWRSQRQQRKEREEEEEERRRRRGEGEEEWRKQGRCGSTCRRKFSSWRRLLASRGNRGSLQRHCDTRELWSCYAYLMVALEERRRGEEDEEGGRENEEV